MRRAFTVNLALTLAANLLVKPIYIFGVEVGVQNAVGTVAYGRLGYWVSVALLFATVLDLGLQNYTAVALARQPERVQEVVPVSLSLKLLVTPLYAGLVLAAAALLGMNSAEFRLIAWIIATQVGLSTWQMLRNNLAAQEKYRANSIVSIVDKAFLVIVVGALLYVLPHRNWITIERFAMLQALSVTVAIAITVAATHLAPTRAWLRWDWRALKSLLLASLPFAWTLLLNTLASRVDILMLEWTRPDGDYQVGVYMAGYRLLDAVNMLAFLFATLLIPMLSAQVERGEAVGELLRQGARYMMALTLGAAWFVTFYAQAITSYLFVEATPSWGPVLAALIWSAVPTGLLYVVGSHLLALKKLRALNWIFAGAMLLNVLLNVLLIPRWGALGAGVATALTQGLIVLAEAIVSYRAQAEAAETQALRRLLWQTVAYSLGVAAVVGACAYLHLVLLPAFAVAVLACGVLALMSGLVVDPRALLGLLRGRFR